MDLWSRIGKRKFKYGLTNNASAEAVTDICPFNIASPIECCLTVSVAQPNNFSKVLANWRARQRDEAAGIVWGNRHTGDNPRYPINSCTYTVTAALAKHERSLPQELYPSLIWDRESETADHKRFTEATWIARA